MVNRTIKNFEIKELIATGGMAAIYRSIQLSLDRVVAVKILHGHLAQDNNFITRFEREAKAAANLQHENIVNIIDYGKAEEVYFIAMEYVEGISLKDLMSSIKFIPYDIALAIAQSIIQGLEHAHKKGVVHRDIKPANILIGRDGNAKIADFGLAQAQDLTSVTVTGSIVGTPAYMSPEQAGGRKVDARTDIFSLGVVIYEMITGLKPFSGDNYSSVIHEILTVKPPRPVEANPLIPPEIDAIIGRMLEKDLELRYQTISEVNQDVRSYFKKHSIEISHANISEFIATPAKHFDVQVRERKNKHFERALYFIGLGDEKLDEAIAEISKVLHLDPDDSKAQRYMADLREKKRITVKKKKVQAKAEKAAPQKRKQESRRIHPLLPIGIIIGVAAVITVILLLNAKRGSGIAEIPDSVGAIRISSVPESAAIYLDGVANNSVTPFLLDSVALGSHTIELRRTGYQNFLASVEVKAGDGVAVNAIMVKEVKVATYGTISVRSKPPGARVYLDNANTGLSTPCMVNDVTAGSHRIKIMMKDYKTVELSRTIVAGETENITVTLLRTASSVLPQKVAYLKVTVIPWAKIYIDGKYCETTPIARPLEITAGSHNVKLENPNFKTWEKKITLQPDETRNIDVKLQPADGFLKLTVRPWADVYIDGKFYETTPITQPIKLTAGRHVLKLINPSFEIFEQTIEIPMNKMLKKHVELKPK